jgi:crotonobetainyl-CoA:carnitine CoA-transferase CaiB-like acyl-CoA transferase
MMKHAFDDIKVIELGGYIVGSYCGSLLADMGADVIKFEPLGGDGLRTLLGAFQGWNRGTRGIAVDLRTDEGKVILHELARKSDVLVQNLRQGVAESWGADYETLSRLNPGIIYCAMPGYGQSGPYIEKPAFDPLLQARSGAMAAQGGTGNAPVYYRSAICDYAGAMLGAYGVALALYQRARTGKGQYLHGALLNAAIAVQSGEFITYQGKPEDDPRMDFWGTSATYRLYKTEDGWIFLGCCDESLWPSLCQALGQEELTSDSRFNSPTKRKENAAQLTELFNGILAGNSSQYWLNLLEEAAVPCAPVYYSRELFEHPHMLENDLIAEHESADLGKLKQMGLIIKLSETPGKLQRAAPGLGQHTDEILSELGYSRQTIQELRDKRITG